MNDAPIISSPNGGTDVTINYAENGTVAVTTVVATDVDSNVVNYTLSGADASKFSISTSGVLTFNASPNYEAPTDAGADNTYNLTVTASDGTLADTQNLSVKVADLLESDTDTSNDFDALTGGTTNTSNTVTGTNGNDTLTGGSNSQTFNVGNGDDVIYGAGGNDDIRGSNGFDKLYGQAGNDTLQGAADNDTLYGGSGDDRLSGGAGSDKLWGGSGNDTFVFGTTAESAAGSVDTVADFHQGFDKIDVSGFVHTFSGSTATANSLWFTYDGASNVTHIYGDTNGNPASAEFQLDVTGHVNFTTSDFVL